MSLWLLLIPYGLSRAILQSWTSLAPPMGAEARAARIRTAHMVDHLENRLDGHDDIQARLDAAKPPEDIDA